jgi:hypothetical protein
MAKKAFCVGINDYPYEGNDLKGCVNDALAWADLLVGHFDFPRPDVRVLTDRQATKRNIMAGLKSLLTGATAGDVLVFANSSHGTYVVDTSGDEPKYDEAICPYDVARNVILDDELRALFAGLPRGVRLTVISDSCFSGTVTRALFRPDVRVRFLNPALLGAPAFDDPWAVKARRAPKYPQSQMKELLLSGCTDREYSYDALIDGVYHGAMTCYAIQAIRAANYPITYAELVGRVNVSLTEAGYDQHPQLEGKSQHKKRPVFT